MDNKETIIQFLISLGVNNRIAFHLAILINDIIENSNLREEK
jgi:hypothetical protein